MKRLKIPWPISGGVILSYKCTSECSHCMYACSPRWHGDWMSLEFFEKVLSGLGERIKKYSPYGKVSMNYGLHFTGGEPFLNYELLLNFVELSCKHEIYSNFVETNCYWCTDDKVVEERFTELKSMGLGGVLVSVNPFLIEFVPFENIERAIRVGYKVFKEGLMVYHPNFYRDMRRLSVSGRVKFGSYLVMADREALSSISDQDVLLPMGRLVWRHWSIFKRFPPEYFFYDNCLEELTRQWHIHIDNYANYISGYCAGLSLGKYDGSNTIFEEGVDLEKHPVLKAIVSSLGELYRYADENFDYRPKRGGYVSKCHLCLDIRKNLIERGADFEELNPRQFYYNL
ncbi:MAG: hypothetical protein ACUVTL_06660 [Thermoproteota archaeon]